MRRRKTWISNCSTLKNVPVFVREHESFCTPCDSSDRSLLKRSIGIAPSLLWNSRSCIRLSSECWQVSLLSISASFQSIYINSGATWKKYGVTVAGGNGPGAGISQLSYPFRLFLDNNQFLYIIEWGNHRVTKWNLGSMVGQIVAGGNGKGSRNDQLDWPNSIVMDRRRNSLFIGDYGNNRIVQWSLQGARSGKTIISGVSNTGLTMDEQGFLYVSDYIRNEVRRWYVGSSQGILVAGGNGPGNRLNQLYGPRQAFVDQNHSVYVPEANSNRVTKWVKGAAAGIVVAGGRGRGSALSQLNFLEAVTVDQLGTIYIADRYNHRIVRWRKGATTGDVLVGGNGAGSRSDQLNHPTGLLFDRQGNLFVADHYNHRVQKFEIV